MCLGCPKHSRSSSNSYMGPRTSHSAVSKAWSVGIRALRALRALRAHVACAPRASITFPRALWTEATAVDALDLRHELCAGCGTGQPIPYPFPSEGEMAIAKWVVEGMMDDPWPRCLCASTLRHNAVRAPTGLELTTLKTHGVQHAPRGPSCRRAGRRARRGMPPDLPRPLGPGSVVHIYLSIFGDVPRATVPWQALPPQAALLHVRGRTRRPYTPSGTS